MTDISFYDPDGSELPPPAPPQPLSTTHLSPTDDFDVPLHTPPYTIFYLTIRTPHTDTFTLHGPVQTFTELLPAIQTACASSPAALQKLSILRQPPKAGQKDTFLFDSLGFTSFIIPHPHTPSAFSILEVIREVNEPVWDILPAAVYVVTAHGPLQHDTGGLIHSVASGKARGMAANSRIVGSWVDVETARRRARESMDGMIEAYHDSQEQVLRPDRPRTSVEGEGQECAYGDEEEDEEDKMAEEWREGKNSGKSMNITRTERMEPGGMRRWVLLGMSAKFVWEVRVRYDEGG